MSTTDAPRGDGTPYRALEPIATTRSLATAAKPDPILAAVPIVFGAAACLSSLINAIAAATVAAVFAIGFGLARFLASRIRAPRLDADRGGLRLRCPTAAQISEPALATTKRVDLVIPWAEYTRAFIESRYFDDGPVDALVITTPTQEIAVRADIFAEPPLKILARIAAAQTELGNVR